MRPEIEAAETRWQRPRWYELLPELVLIAGLSLFLADEPDAATSAFRSTRALGLMAAGAVAWVGARLLLARTVPWRSLRTLLFGLAAIGVLAVVVLPAYNDTTVVEAFPMPTAASAPAAPPTTLATPVAPSEEVAMPAMEATAATTEVTAVTPPEPVEPPEPVLLRTGPFAGIDHRAAGTVSIYRTPEGREVVGLEAFDIQPGPDYDVYVVPGSDRRDRDGGVRLDDLRGNQGTQYYDVPTEVDLAAGEWTVLIWCQTFGVPVANATPA